MSARITCALRAAMAGLATLPALAQQERIVVPEVSFVTGDARPLGLSSFGRAEFAAVFETRPELPPRARSASYDVAGDIMRSALTSVYGSAEFDERFPAGSRRSCAYVLPDRTAGVAYQTIEQRAKDIWTVAAADEETVKSLVRALLENYARQVSANLAGRRNKLLSQQKQIEDCRRVVQEQERQVDAAQTTLQELGLEHLTDDMIDSAMARLEQERRLNEIDIHGINARLDAVRERLQAARDAAAGRRAEAGEGDQELLRVLNRIQVELEIELIGKLARRGGLAHEMEVLRKGREAKAASIKAPRGLDGNKRRLRSLERGAQSLEQDIQKLQQLARFTVVDGQIVVSRVAADD